MNNELTQPPPRQPQRPRGMSAKGGYLIPTKATLFGLDVRFKHIDEKIVADEEKLKS